VEFLSGYWFYLWVVGRKWLMVKAAKPPLPDDALVVRGGQNQPKNFITSRGVMIDSEGKAQGISVNSAPQQSVRQLTAPNLQTGYPGIPNKQVGVTTVGAIRAAGGDVVPSPSAGNSNHATLGGLTPDQASRLFRPTAPNPNRGT
jgi:hypothetical protein